jgi:PAS domain S-box-containing protein
MKKNITIEKLQLQNNQLQQKISEFAASNKKLESLIDKLPQIIVESDLKGNLTYLNQKGFELTGYTKEDFHNGLNASQFVIPEERLLLSQNMQRVLKGKSLQGNEYTALRKDGTTFFALIYSSHKFEIGQAQGMRSIIVDITERKKDEKHLQETYDIINESPAVTFLWKNMEGWPVEFVSENVMKLFGYTATDFVSGKVSYAEVVHTEDLERVAGEVAGFSIGKEHERFVHEPYRIVTKDGKVKWLDDQTFIRRDEKGKITHYQGIVLDITERKQLEEERLKVQKLESTGVLAGGIAHDFNNILTAIIGNISMAKIYAESNEKVIEKLTEAEKASLRAQDLSQQLLTFSKGGQPIKKLTKLTDLIKDSASFALTGSNVNCNLFMADKLWPVNIDEGQISQVIQNVIKNADQAMPDGGTVTIQAENKTISGKEPLPLKEGKYVWITIKDQGGGIPEKFIAKIFDPYFSTKQEGSGLGLAASFSIVKKHDGHISAESEPGEGTTFHIYLPASEKMPSVKKRAKKKSLQSGEKILIMDDDQAVLKIATQMLNMMGFKTETATNGQEAVTLYKKAQKDGRPFGAVLLDLTIPGGMGGKETVKQLVQIDPEVKAIVSSGYANDPIMADYKSFGFSSVVSKPYDIEKLGEALRVFFC